VLRNLLRWSGIAVTTMGMAISVVSCRNSQNNYGLLEESLTSQNRLDGVVADRNRMPEREYMTPGDYIVLVGFLLIGSSCMEYARREE